MEQPVGGQQSPPSVLPTIATHEHPEGIALGEHGSFANSWGLLMAAIFWNGITCCVLTPFLLGGAEAWPILLFGALFVLVGLFLIVQVVRRFITGRRFAPPELIVPRWPLFLGARTPILYRRAVRGAAAQVERISAKLVCTEVATYTQGTDTRTVREKLWEETLPDVQPQRGVEIAEARWEIRIPSDLPPSFEAYRNQIIWTVEVTLHVASFPDDLTHFQLLVRPEIAR